MKKVQDRHISLFLGIAGIILICLTLALTLNGRVLEDNIFHNLGGHGSQQHTQQTNHPKPPRPPKPSTSEPKPKA